MRHDAETRLLEQVFGRLTVVEYAGKDGGRHYWACECECGNMTTVRQDSLLGGDTQSCGCLSSEQAAERARARVAHGHARDGERSSTYISWRHMLERCRNPNHPSYVNYGARGIDVCASWYEFAGFLADMGEQPQGLTLERVDNDGGYYLDNCRWATRREQQRNTRQNHLLEFDGREQCLSAWAEEFGLNYSTLQNRLHLGWSIEEALTTPVRGTE